MRSRLVAATVLLFGSLLLTGCAVKVPGTPVAASGPAPTTTTPTTTTTYPMPGTAEAGYAYAGKLPAGFPLAPGTTVPYAHDDGKVILGQLRLAGGYEYYRAVLPTHGFTITFKGHRKVDAPAGTPDSMIEFTGNGFGMCRFYFTGDRVIVRFERA